MIFPCLTAASESYLLIYAKGSAFGADETILIELTNHHGSNCNSAHGSNQASQFPQAQFISSRHIHLVSASK